MPRTDEGEARGLGRRFRAEINNVLARMTENPLPFPVIFKKAAKIDERIANVVDPFANSE